MSKIEMDKKKSETRVPDFSSYKYEITFRW